KMGIMPAYGFFIRHVKGIKMNNVEVSYMGKEICPAFYLDDVKDADFFRVKSEPVKGVKTFVLNNVENLSIRQTNGIENKMVKKTAAESF
ncbi:MAG: glycoside hydrolase family 28 protein, partial [Bacteroidota bacterium]